MTRMQRYKSSSFFRKDFPFALRHAINRADIFNKNTRFQRDFWKITYLIRGSGRLIIQDTEYPIHPGSILLIHPDSITTYDIDTDELELYNLLFSTSLIENDLKTLQDHYHFFAVFSDAFQQSEQARLYIQNTGHTIKKQIQEIVREYELEASDFHAVIKYKLLELLVFMMREGERFLKKNTTRGIAEYVKTFLSNHYRESISLHVLAKEVGLTPNHLCTLYKSACGTSMIAELKQIRLNHADHLLRNSALSISEICFQSGFHDLSYFYRAFDEKFHCSPGEWKKQFRMDNLTILPHKQHSEK